MKRFYSFFLALMACMTMQAQYVVSDKYDLWFEDTGHEVTTRKSVDCTDNYQDLWNGCYVKTSGSRIYIYRNNSSGIYGKHIYYFPFGYVTLQRGSGYWDIYHCSGRKVDCYSDECPFMFWNGCFLIKQGKYWYAVDGDGDKIDGVYGDEVTLLNNGSWKCVRGSYVTYID